MAKRKPAVKSDEPAKKRKVQSTEPPEKEDATAAAQPQRTGDLFVLGNVDCGQAGRGEDFLDAPRPVPTLGDHKVSAFQPESLLARPVCNSQKFLYTC